MFSLRDKVALVTGASQGIGRATALALAEAGAKVGVAARSADKLASLVSEIEGAGGEALAVPMSWKLVTMPMRESVFRVDSTVAKRPTPAQLEKAPSVDQIRVGSPALQPPTGFQFYRWQVLRCPERGHLLRYICLRWRDQPIAWLSVAQPVAKVKPNLVIALRLGTTPRPSQS